MTNMELQQKLDEIRSGMKMLDLIVDVDYETGIGELNERQVKVVYEFFRLLESLNWQVKFNNYKELKYEDSEPINKRECGTPVKVSSCKKEHGDKTCFGILIGEVALSIGHSIDKEGNVTAKRQGYNPAIYIPELNDIVYGCESWWQRIKSEKELNKLITEEIIENVWYMKMLKNWTEEKEIEIEEEDEE